MVDSVDADRPAEHGDGGGGVLFSFFFSHFYFPASGQAVVTGVVPSSPPVLAFQLLSRIGFSNPTARRFFIEGC